MDTERRIREAVEIGEHNKEIAQLVQNFCAHIRIERRGGVGLVEQMTNLPIGHHQLRCAHAKARGIAAMQLDEVALDFYDRNCVGCVKREPVRLPNITRLVEAREIERGRQAESAKRYREDLAHALEARSERRTLLRPGLLPPAQGILDIIERLDREPSDEGRQLLVKTARSVSGVFTSPIQEALFELTAADSHHCIEGALECLSVIPCDSIRLGEAALRALRHGSSRIAAKIVERGIDTSLSKHVMPVVPSLAFLASSRRHLAGMQHTVVTEPGPLLRLFEQFPQGVTQGLRRMLLSSSKGMRTAACEAIIHLLEVDPSLGSVLAPELTRSFELPDDHYGREGSAESAAAAALSEAMRLRPHEIDAAIQEGLAKTTDAHRSALFKTYTELVRKRVLDHEVNTPVSDAERIAFRRIVDAFSTRASDDVMREAAYWLREHAGYYPSLLQEHADTLLGAAALLASDLDNPYSPLIDPRPDPMKSIEAENRTISLDTALDAISSALGLAASISPEKIGRDIVTTFENLGDSADRLRVVLVPCLGALGRNKKGLPVALPALYNAMTDASSMVRAAAAQAYGSMCETNAEDLPDLVHEMFLVLLSDPFVLVHRAAARAASRTPLPARYRARLLSALAALIRAYSGNNNDGFLAEALKCFLGEAQGAGTWTPQLRSQALRIVDRMSGREAAQFLDGYGRFFRPDSKYPALILKLLADSSIYDWNIKGLIRELQLAPQEAMSALGEEICRAASVCERRGEPRNDLFLQILSVAGAWTVAAKLAEAAVGGYEGSTWDRPRELLARTRHIAVQMEGAAASRNIGALQAAIGSWRAVLADIERDENENREARERMPFGLPGSTASRWTDRFVAVYGNRIAASAAIAEIATGSTSTTVDTLDHAAERLISASDTFADEAVAQAYRDFGSLAQCLSLLLSWLRAVRAAETDAGRYLRAAVQRARDVERSAGPALTPPARDAVSAVLGVSDTAQIENVARQLIFPLPLATAFRERRGPMEPSVAVQERRRDDRNSIAVAFAAFYLNGSPLRDPHALQAGIIYDLSLTVVVSDWPEGAERLVLDAVTVEPPSCYDLPRIVFEKPKGAGPYTLQQIGHMVIHRPQVMFARPLEFSYRAYFEPEIRNFDLSVEGQRSIRLQSFDSTINPVSGYRDVDIRIFDIRDRARRVPGVRDEELEHFMRVLIALGNIAAQGIQDHMFPGQWSEPELQKKLRELLRSNPTIGSDLEEHPHAAAGITDLSFRGIRIELKVENQRPVTMETAERYSQQTTQYVVGSDRRFGLLFVLDCSPKSEAPGSVANDIELKQIPSPTGGQIPTLLGVVIGRGNLAIPSSLSR